VVQDGHGLRSGAGQPGSEERTRGARDAHGEKFTTCVHRNGLRFGVWGRLAAQGLGGIVGGRNRGCQAAGAYTTTPDTPSCSVGLRGPNLPSVGSAQQNQASVRRGGRRLSGASTGIGSSAIPAVRRASALT